MASSSSTTRMCSCAIRRLHGDKTPLYEWGQRGSSGVFASGAKFNTTGMLASAAYKCFFCRRLSPGGDAGSLLLAVLRGCTRVCFMGIVPTVRGCAGRRPTWTFRNRAGLWIVGGRGRASAGLWPERDRCRSAAGVRTRLAEKLAADRAAEVEEPEGPEEQALEILDRVAFACAQRSDARSRGFKSAPGGIRHAPTGRR